MGFKMDRRLFQLDGGLYFDLRHYFLYVFPHHSRLLRRLLKGATSSPRKPPKKTPPPRSGWTCGDGASANLTAPACREAKEQRRIKAALENERSTRSLFFCSAVSAGCLSGQPRREPSEEASLGGVGQGRAFWGDFSPELRGEQREERVMH